MMANTNELENGKTGFQSTSVTFDIKTIPRKNTGVYEKKSRPPKKSAQ